VPRLFVPARLREGLVSTPRARSPPSRVLRLGPGADLMLGEGSEWQATIEVLDGVGLDAVPAWHGPGMAATGKRAMSRATSGLVTRWKRTEA
jgi:hypothetical protein